MKTLVIWSFVLLLGVARLLAGASDERLSMLNKIATLCDARIGNWTVSTDGTHWDNYTPGKRIDAEQITLSATLPGYTVFAGQKVAGSPLHMRLQLSGRGLCSVQFMVDDNTRDTFTIDGASGKEIDITKDINLSEKVDAKPIKISIRVHNQGFLPARDNIWPARQKALSETGLVFSITNPELHFPAHAAAITAVQNWLTCFKIANTLINPELVRYTFTKKPFAVPDQRQLKAGELAHLNKQLQYCLDLFNQQALAAGDSARVQQSIAKSYAAAQDIGKYVKNFHVTLIGNAHIDIAWLWRMCETVEVAHNTYATVLQNMLEYPELHYAQSQALTYEWIEAKYPELFKQIQQKVKLGQWEIVGGMYVEPDCNLISGESWVRQLLLGKTYFKEKFGVDVHIGWNPDSFGYNWNMPQIYQKSGIDCFITQKLWWNDTTVFPHFFFWWQGADNTRLLTYLPPLPYDSELKLDELLSGISNFQVANGQKATLVLYGLGDHGGGPNREILNRARGYATLPIAPTLQHGLAKDFINHALAQKDLNLPVWQDELYLEYHQGTFTTQGAVKKNNRRSESLLSSTEKAASIAQLLGGFYPQQALQDAWKTVCANQFHDILPGSSITAVYRDSMEAHAQVQKQLAHLQRKAMTQLAQQINTSSQNGTAIVVFNPLSWERSDLVTVKSPYPAAEAVKVIDAAGAELASETSTDELDESASIRFMARCVPSIGYKTFFLVKGAPNTATRLQASARVLENDLLRIELDIASGNISRIWDKRLQRDFLAKDQQGNVLWIYEDRPERWDAWNIGYTGRGWELNRADSIELVRISPVSATIRIKKSFLGLSKDRMQPTEDFPSSFFSQDISIYPGSDRVDFTTTADWWEDHLALKVKFPLAVKADFATYEIPFAAIQRTTRFETLWEKARYETPALRWADLSDSQGGISLLNDCKYGYDVHGNVMKLSLLRAPTYPDLLADRGKHAFTYAIYPHAGAFSAADTVRRGMELNIPLLAISTDLHTGSLPAAQSFFAIDNKNIILETVKYSEKNDGLIVRLYEAYGQPQQATLTLFKTPQRMVETDLLENELKPQAMTGNQVTLEFKKFAIRTFKIKF